MPAQSRSFARYSPLVLLGLLLGLVACTLGCGPRREILSSGELAGTKIRGSGATFPQPLYTKWIVEFNRRTKVNIDYDGVGSSLGVKNITAQKGDFGASDTALTGEQVAAAQHVLHFPVTLSAVAVVYHLKSRPQLRFTSDALARIYLGEVHRWDDPVIAALNPDIDLPDEDIIVAHRTDGGGTTKVFTRFLSDGNETWRNEYGVTAHPTWPDNARGGKGNRGVAQTVSSTPFSIGYVALNFARARRLPTAELMNIAGKYVGPSLDSVTAAAANHIEFIPEDLRTSLVNVGGESSYPISSFSYLLVPRDGEDVRKRRALIEFVDWALHEGQRYSPFLHYASLPPSVIQRAEVQLETLRINGKTWKEAAG